MLYPPTEAVQNPSSIIPYITLEVQRLCFDRLKQRKFLFGSPTDHSLYSHGIIRSFLRSQPPLVFVKPWPTTWRVRCRSSPASASLPLRKSGARPPARDHHGAATLEDQIFARTLVRAKRKATGRVEKRVGENTSSIQLV